MPSDNDPELPEDTAWHPVDALPRTAFDHESIVRRARDRLRAKLSYTNLGFALAPPTFTISALRELYSAALGYRVSATNLQRVLSRRGLLEPTGRHRASPAAAGGRPAALFRFAERGMEVTDPFAVLRPPAKLRRRFAVAEMSRGQRLDAYPVVPCPMTLPLFPLQTVLLPGAHCRCTSSSRGTGS